MEAILLLLVPKLWLDLSLTILKYIVDIWSNNVLFLDSETFGQAVKSYSKRSYSSEGIYYDSRFSRFYDLVPIQEKCEDQEGPDIGDFRSLASRSSGSGGSGHGRGVFNLTPDKEQGNKGICGGDIVHGEDNQSK